MSKLFFSEGVSPVHVFVTRIIKYSQVCSLSYKLNFKNFRSAVSGHYNTIPVIGDDLMYIKPALI